MAAEPRVLVTNDDGVDAPGIHALAIGNLQAGGTIRTERRALRGLDHIEAHGVDGPPALAVMAAHLGGFGPPPDVVVSGINPGHNTGRATLHSGTVGAALTAANFGVSGLAVSIGWADDPQWATAGAIAVAALRWLLAAPPKTVVNLNVPNLALSEVRGIRWANLAPFGTVRAAIAPNAEGSLQMELRQTEDELPADSDSALVAEGYAAVSTLVGICSGPPEPIAHEIEAILDGQDLSSAAPDSVDLARAETS